jgi:hypothetical protein
MKAQLERLARAKKMIPQEPIEVSLRREVLQLQKVALIKVERERNNCGWWRTA